MKNLPTLRNDFSFAVQFNILVSKTRAILLFTIKIIEIFAWSPLKHTRDVICWSNYQTTIPLKILIIMRMFRQSTNQNHHSVFWVSDDVTGWHWRMVDSDVAERRKRLEAIGWNLGYPPLKIRIALLPASEIVNAPARAWLTRGVALKSQKRDCLLCTWHKSLCWRRTGTR